MAALVGGFGHRHFAGRDRDLRAAGVDPGHACGIHAGGRGGAGASIFRPSAPLHDGAVSIQKDRIAAAACFLPLSMNPVLSTQLGTRHRAGIGVTEETDAIAVIVSEETGAISLAVAAKIERDLTV